MNVTTHPDTQITADPKVPLVRIVREFNAPAAKVFRAHVDPQLVAQWMGTSRHEMRVEHYDCRTGGSWRYVMSRDGIDFGFHGSFHDVRPDDLVMVQTFTFDGFPEQVALERLELSDLPDGRCRLTATSLVESFESRDAFLASGMDTGVIEGYERLDELLAT